MRTRVRWKQFPCPVPHCDAYKWGDCKVFVGQEPVLGDPWPKSWHLSISHPFRYPTWDEIKAARYDLLPHDVTMAMILPPTSEYVNIHENCFHLHQIVADSEAAKRIVA
jgi:hypothetical protein